VDSELDDERILRFNATREENFDRESFREVELIFVDGDVELQR
jgi:hypothetical protein